MCDQDSLDDMMEYEIQPRGLSRRQFGGTLAGAGLVSLLPPAADARAVTGTDVMVETPDGKADAYFAHPTRGKHSGVLMWPDIFGLRPAFKQMAARLATSGYSVLVVNPFYRTQRAPTSPPHPDFNDPATRKELFALMSSLTPERVVTDAQAFIPWIERQSSVSSSRKMATTGYCMGGPFTFRTAAAFPDRIGAGCSFHGASLVTDGPDSPHLLIPRIKAEFLVAIAANDDARQPDAKTILRDAFMKAHLYAEVQVYPGTMHGWCPTDSRVYNPAQAELAWSRQLALLERALA